MNLANINTRWIDASGLLAVLGMTAMVWWIGIAPRMADGAQSQTLAAELAEKQTLASDLSARVAAATANEQRSRERLADFDLQLSPPDQLNRLLRDINAIAETTGVRIASLLPGESAMGDPVGKVIVRVQGSGTTESIDSFVAAIAERFGDVRTQSLRIGVGGDARQGTQFDADLIWFVRPPGAATRRPAS